MLQLNIDQCFNNCFQAPGYPPAGGMPVQDPLYGYFAAVAGAVSTYCSIVVELKPLAPASWVRFIQIVRLNHY